MGRTAPRSTPATRAWAPLSLDEKRGISICRSKRPTGDYFRRPSSWRQPVSYTLACLDIRPEEAVHFRPVHHDIWTGTIHGADLADVMINGQPREIVAQLTKRPSFLSRSGDRKSHLAIERSPSVRRADRTRGGHAAFPTRPKAYDRQASRKRLD